MLRLTVPHHRASINSRLLFSVPQSNSNLTRLTNTPEHTVNLNPTLSDDGRVVVFESSADLVRGGESSSFHAFRADLDGVRLLSRSGARAQSRLLCRAMERLLCLHRRKISSGKMRIETLRYSCLTARVSSN